MTTSNSPVSNSSTTEAAISLVAGLGGQAAQAHRGQALELEDLQHVDQVDAGRDDDQPERDHDQRPAGVEVAVVVGVGDEAQGDGEPGEHQRPAVEVEDGAADAEADPGHAVMEVLAVGLVERLVVLEPLEHDERRVEERHGEQDQRQRRTTRRPRS